MRPHGHRRYKPNFAVKIRDKQAHSAMNSIIQLIAAVDVFR